MALRYLVMTFYIMKIRFCWDGAGFGDIRGKRDRWCSGQNVKVGKEKKNIRNASFLVMNTTKLRTKNTEKKFHKRTCLLITKKTSVAKVFSYL